MRPNQLRVEEPQNCSVYCILKTYRTGSRHVKNMGAPLLIQTQDDQSKAPGRSGGIPAWPAHSNTNPNK